MGGTTWEELLGRNYLGGTTWEGNFLGGELLGEKLLGENYLELVICNLELVTWKNLEELV